MAAQKAPQDVPFVQDLSAPLSEEPTQVMNDLKGLWKYLTGKEKAAGPESWSGGSDQLQNVGCQAAVQFKTSPSDTYCFVLCAKPNAAASFGTYFPLMPGAANVKDEASDSGVFLLRFITLEDPVWVYYVSSSPSKDELKTKLQLLPDWYSQWSQHLPPDKLSLDSQNGLTMWGNLPDLPGLEELRSFLGPNSLKSSVKARVTYPDGLPILTVEMTLGETGLGGHTLGNAFLELSSPLYYSPGSATIGLRGDLQLKNPTSGESYTLGAEVDFPFNGDIVTVKGAFKESKPPFIDISQLPGGIPQRKAPSGGASSGELDALLKFSKSEKTLKEIGLELELDHWALPPENPLITFEKLDAAFSVFDPLSPDGKEIVASFSADAKLGKNKNIDIQCRGDCPSGQLYFSLLSTDGLKLNTLIQELTDENLKDLNVPDLELRELDLTYNYRNNYFSAEIDVAGAWEQQGFCLEDLRFAVRGGVGELELQVAARFELGKTAFQLGAAYRSQTDTAGAKTKSWQFLGLADNIPLDKLFADLKAHFHSSTELPAALAGLHVDNLEVTFSSESAANSGSKTDFLFDCNMIYQVADDEADISFKIHVNKQKPENGSHSGQPSHTFEFSGQITIGGEEFELDFKTMAKKGKNGKPGDPQSMSLLTANYTHEGEIDVGELTADLPEIGQLMHGIKINLKDALFATLKEDQRPRKYLFGIDIGVDLNFDLSTVPVAGELLGGGDFSIDDFRFFMASDAFFDNEVAVFPGKDRGMLYLPPPGGAAAAGPAGQPAPKLVVLKKGVNFRANMTLGSGPTIIPQPFADTISQADADSAQPPPTPTTPSSSDSKTTAVWLDVNKTFGPVTIARIGATYSDQKIWFLVNASFSAGVLTITLDGLGIGSPIDKFAPSVTIRGLSLSYKSGPVELSGGFIASQDMKSFAGEALVKAEVFSLSATGLYSDQGDFKSAFLFVMVDYPLGGSEEFFVTGLAGGFGYNNRLRIPKVNEIKRFMLVQAAMADSSAEPNPLAPVKDDPGKVLQKLLPEGGGNVVALEKGENWLAAGVRFTTYDLINSLAMVIVEFGHELEIAIVGLSAISLPPPPVPGGEPVQKYAYAELAIEIKILPAQGAVEASAVLTPASFVLDPNCKLTGGFAFFTWFGDNPHAGEFVLTLGGYHPRFPVPAYYPTVPRLGFNWPVEGFLTIKGEAYFAMTPSAIMAGGRLQVLFHSGPIRAWLIAQMDALIVWAPFHFELGIAVSVGVSARVELLFVTITLSVEVSATLSVWGPKMGGVAHIDLGIISFSIGFGDDNQKKDPLPWSNENGTGFAQTLLPHKKEGNPTIKPEGVHTITVHHGLRNTLELANDAGDGQKTESIWIVRPDHFEFSALSAIPATAVNVVRPANGHEDGESIHTAHYQPDGVHIRPMEITLADTTLVITLTNLDIKEIEDLSKHFDHPAALKAVPGAKWGTPLGENGLTVDRSNEPLAITLSGIERVKPKESDLTPTGDLSLTFAISSTFTYDVVDDREGYHPDHLPLSPVPQPGEKPPLQRGERDGVIGQISRTFGDQKTQQARTDIFGALAGYGIQPGQENEVVPEPLTGEPGRWIFGTPLLQQDQDKG